MGIETKEEYLARMTKAEAPLCPHCSEKMSIWEAPTIAFSDGLGWGAPYLFVCFNDECSMYKQGWEDIEAQVGYKASYRCMCYLGEDKFECIPVFSPFGGKGQVIDEQVAMQEEMLKENIKKGFSILADCFVNNDGVTVLRLLLDPAEPVRVRVKAAEMIGDIGPLDVVDTLRNAKFGNEILQEKVDEGLEKIHARFFTRECPFCAEIIKKKAKICKHCGKDVAGE